jgi:hypothetical protein
MNKEKLFLPRDGWQARCPSDATSLLLQGNRLDCSSRTNASVAIVPGSSKHFLIAMAKRAWQDHLHTANFNAVLIGEGHLSAEE